MSTKLWGWTRIPRRCGWQRGDRGWLGSGVVVASPSPPQRTSAQVGLDQQSSTSTAQCHHHNDRRDAAIDRSCHSDGLLTADGVEHKWLRHITHLCMPFPTPPPPDDHGLSRLDAARSFFPCSLPARPRPFSLAKRTITDLHIKTLTDPWPGRTRCRRLIDSPCRGPGSKSLS